jgi:hypothetical protein
MLRIDARSASMASKEGAARCTDAVLDPTLVETGSSEREADFRDWLFEARLASTAVPILNSQDGGITGTELHKMQLLFRATSVLGTLVCYRAEREREIHAHLGSGMI